MPLTVLLYGNCQAETLAQIGRFLPSLREAVTFKVIASHIVTAADWRTRFNDSFTGDVQVLWEQVASGEPEEHRAMLRARQRPEWHVVRFPPYSMTALWPFSGGDDPRLHTNLPYRYSWTDSVGVAVAQEGPADDDTAFARYMQLSLERMPDVQQELARDVARWRAADAAADIKEADWVLDTIRDRQIFHAPGHLTALPLGRMMKQLLERTPLLEARQVWQAKLEVDLLLRRHRGQDVEMLPVHPAVAAQLGLRYYDPETRYRWHGHEWSFREYMLNYIRWEPFLQ